MTTTKERWEIGVEAKIHMICAHYLHKEVAQTARHAIDHQELLVSEVARLLVFITSEIQKAEVRTEKAFGGCKKCYGKGYATQIENWTGRGYSKAAPYYLPCTCDRGRQIETLISKAQVEVLDEVAKEVEALDIGRDDEADKNRTHDAFYHDGYNEAVSDATTKIRARITNQSGE